MIVPANQMQRIEVRVAGISFAMMPVEVQTVSAEWVYADTERLGFEQRYSFRGGSASPRHEGMSPRRNESASAGDDHSGRSKERPDSRKN
jgi:hypothetical protein